MRILPIVLLISCIPAFGQLTVQPQTVKARMIVTAAHFYGENVPVLTQKDFSITQLYRPLTVTGVTPLRDNVEMYLLVDNCSDCEPGPKIDELHKFIRSQPAATAIGVAYVVHGSLRIAEQPTKNREAVIKALSPPTGGPPANPFAALADLITQWKPDSTRHMVVMITNGIDPQAEERQRNAAADAAIEAAQRNAVTVFTIYHPSADYAKGDFYKTYAGQIQIAHVANETGGEAYFLSFGPLPSLGPFLSDITEHLANQYAIEFLIAPSEGTGAFQDVSVKARDRDVEIIAPSRVWVPGKP